MALNDKMTQEMSIKVVYNSDAIGWLVPPPLNTNLKLTVAYINYN